jgi:hypothetical protein
MQNYHEMMLLFLILEEWRDWFTGLYKHGLVKQSFGNLSAMWSWGQEYKREEEVYNLYKRTRKWEMYKVLFPITIKPPR